jgi:hypothetical protein
MGASVAARISSAVYVVPEITAKARSMYFKYTFQHSYAVSRSKFARSDTASASIASSRAPSRS